MLTSFFVFFLCVNQQLVESKNTCNDECLSKTYCLSNDWTNDCSSILVKVKFTAIQSQSGFPDYLNITLIGYDIKPSDDQTIQLTVNKTNQSYKDNYHPTSYCCHKSSLGSTVATVEHFYTEYDTGSSLYFNGLLYCNWIITPSDIVWPTFNWQPVDFINDAFNSFQLSYGNHSSIVASNSSELPLYHVQFLGCCNEIYGDENHVFTFQTSTSISYLLQLIGLTSEVTMISYIHDSFQVNFICNFASSSVNGTIEFSNNSISIDDQIFDKYIVNGQCSWSTSLMFRVLSDNLLISNYIYQLMIVSDGVVVSIENNVAFKSSAKSLQINRFLLVAITISLSRLFFAKKLYF